MRVVVLFALGLFALASVLVAGGCKKKSSAPSVTKLEEPTPEPIDPRNTAHVPGSGTVEMVRKAAKRAVTMNDMQQLGTLIFAAELETNKMPTIAEIKEMLKQDALNLLAAIDEGAIILTGTTNKRGLWAYEVDADKAGGVIVTGPTPAARRATAEEVKQYLAKP